MTLLEDILDAAMQTRDLGAFRTRTLEILEPLGFDDGCMASLDPTQPLEDNGLFGKSDAGARMLRTIRARADFFYVDLARYFAHTSVHGVTRDDDPMSHDEFRQTTAFYNELYRPVGFERFVNVLVTPPGRSPAMVALVRSSAHRGFTDLEVHVLKGLRNALALAEGALRRPRYARFLEEALAPIDREILELLALGYTNKQIAVVLQRSPNTVRNRLIRLYAKVGVASRTELIGLLTQADHER